MFINIVITVVVTIVIVIVQWSHVDRTLFEHRSGIYRTSTEHRSIRNIDRTSNRTYSEHLSDINRPSIAHLSNFYRPSLVITSIDVISHCLVQKHRRLVIVIVVIIVIVVSFIVSPPSFPFIVLVVNIVNTIATTILTISIHYYPHLRFNNIVITVVTIHIISGHDSSIDLTSFDNRSHTYPTYIQHLIIQPQIEHRATIRNNSLQSNRYRTSIENVSPIDRTTCIAIGIVVVVIVIVIVDMAVVIAIVIVVAIVVLVVYIGIVITRSPFGSMQHCIAHPTTP